VVEGAVISPDLFANNEESMEESLIPKEVNVEATPSSPLSSSKSRKKKQKKRNILETKLPMDQIHEVDSSRMDTHRSYALNSSRQPQGLPSNAKEMN